MALKKVFKEGTKYYYAVISNLHYAKNVMKHEFGVSHLLQVALLVKDTADPEFLEIENELVYDIPEMKIKKVLVVDTVPKVDPNTGEEIKDKDGNNVMIEVENGIREEFDGSYEDPFKVSNMGAEGMDITKLAYQWLKNNIEFFSDFEDC